ncbi:MAG TPA: hypothetical protein VFI31_23780, partial [Pirellulales bacterium]|nr:hypothetical protein [Pirellulales bacterium]
MLLRSWLSRFRLKLVSRSGRRKPPQPHLERLETRSLMSVTPAAVTFNATEGTAFSGTVATFTTSDHPAPTSNYAATIDWGDGSAKSAGSIVVDGSHFDVVGSHAYLDGDGQQTVKVTINDSADHSHATALSQANVAETPLTLTGTSIVAIEGASFSGSLGTFSDPGTSADPSEYVASINWGDGTISSGTLSYTSGANFDLRGRHTYADEGTYTATVSVREFDSASTKVTATLQVTVDDADNFAGTTMTITPTEGQNFSGVVSVVLPTNPDADRSDFTASIDWGDGQTSAASISLTYGGRWNISGSHTYGDEGTYTAKTTIAEDDLNGATFAFTTTAIVSDADVLSGAGMTINATEGTAFSGAVATFSNTGYAGNPASDFNASIDWGDGTIDTGTVTGKSGAYTVSGTHTYLDEGTYAPVVTLADDVPGTATATAYSTAVVAEGDNGTLSAVTITPAEGQAFSGAVAQFTDNNLLQVAGDFTATVDWGDNTTTTGTVSGGTGNFTISGQHTYADEGTYTIVASFSDDPPSVLTSIPITSTAVVSDSDALAPTGMTLAATEGTAFSGTVATFSNTGYASNPASDFAATIDWGDGTTDIGTVSGGAGSYTVSGTHTYNSENTYTPIVTLTDSDGTASATASSSMTVAEADVLNGTGMSLAATEGTAFTGPVASFSNTGYASNPASDFTATIDWGDGTTDTGTVSGGAGSYTVSGTHTYDSENTYTPIVTLTDSDGTASATASSSMTVAEADVLNGTGMTLAATEGTAFTGAVATFSNTGYASNPASDFAATIDWGDGTTDTGTVSGGAGSYTVSGTHTYNSENTYTPIVTLADSDGSASATASSSMTVAEADVLNGTGMTLAATEGTAFTGPVASFSNTGYASNPATDFNATIDWGDGT